MSDEKYRKAARIIVKAGIFPFPINETLIRILKMVIEEEDLDFIMAFKRKTSMTLEQLKEASKMSEEEINFHVQKLAKVGLIFNQPSSKGPIIYRLMPLVMVGLFEYVYMKKIKHTPEEKALAKLFSKLFEELRDFIQNGYDSIMPIFENMAPYDRTIPIIGKTVNDKEIKIIVNEEITVPNENILLSKEVKNLIDKFDDIAVGHCFCRHHKALLGQPCKQTNLMENCFTFGKSARYTVEQGFARMINKQEALTILKKSEEAGLVHKTFHPHSDITKEETSICNCCKDCCGTFEWWKTGMIAMINYAHYLASINNNCIGCGTCVEKCPVDAIKLNNNQAEVNIEFCIGCGVCAYFCPENAISLKEELRKIYV
ncbi:MAG: indolepyruvate ferredoxin oxidoreductase subunit alpha, partial [Candidatus Thorarchaeota archaeon]